MSGISDLLEKVNTGVPGCAIANVNGADIAYDRSSPFQYYGTTHDVGQELNDSILISIAKGHGVHIDGGQPGRATAQTFAQNDLDRMINRRDHPGADRGQREELEALQSYQSENPDVFF